MPSPPSPVKRVEWRRAIFADDNLPSSSKLVLLALLEYVNDEGKAWPSKARLASDTGYSARSIRTALAVAAAAGWIEVVERYHPNVGQASNGYVLNMGKAIDLKTPRANTSPPRANTSPPRAADAHPPCNDFTPPVQPLHTNKTREQDQRTSSKQASPVAREVWGSLCAAAAVPDVFSAYPHGRQESALLELATAMGRRSVTNPVGLLLTIARDLADDAPSVDASTILAAREPEPVAVEPMRPEWRLFTKEPEPVLTPEEKAAQRAEIEEAKRQARILFGIEEVAS